MEEDLEVQADMFHRQCMDKDQDMMGLERCSNSFRRWMLELGLGYSNTHTLSVEVPRLR